DTEMPLPPSTSGSTSRPEITNGFSAITVLSLPPCRAPDANGTTLYVSIGLTKSNGFARKPCGDAVRAIAEDRLDAPGEQLLRALRQIDGVGEDRQPGVSHQLDRRPIESSLVGVQHGAVERLDLP